MHRVRLTPLASIPLLLLSLLLPARASAQASAQAAPKRLTLNVRDFGAAGDGRTKETAALQRALDRCWALGGCELVVPAGDYLTGALALRSNTTLRFERGATLLGSPDLADYPVTQVRWEGKWIQGHVGLLHAVDAERVAVVGPGSVAGSPSVGGRPTPQSPLRRPALVETIGCDDVRLEDFSTEYQRMWSIHPTNSRNILIRNLTIRSTGGNGDGIDLDSCKRVRIEGCDISTGDDCISVKSGRGMEGYTLLNTSEDILITDCTLADSIYACIGIGSETSGGIRGVRIERCKFTHAQTYAIYIKSRPGRGAFIEDITANDLDVSGMVGGFLRFNFLNSGLQDQEPVPGLEGIPTLRNFRFSNVRVRDVPVLVDGVGVHPEKPLEGFTLSNVTGTALKGISLANIRGAKLSGIKVGGYAGPLLGVHNVTGSGLKGAAAVEAPKPPDPVPAPAKPYRLR